MAVADYGDVRRGEPMELGTRDQHRRAGELVASGLGHLLVANLTVAECDQFLREVAAGEHGKPHGRAQLRRLRGYLINVVANEVRQGFVDRNAAELSVVPEQSADYAPRRPPRALQLAELRALMAAARNVLGVVVDLGGRNGLRPAEVRGLRWSRVDLGERTVRVDAQMNRRNEVVKAKTKRAIRTIRVDSATVARLEAWRETQHRAATEADSYRLGDDELVITTRLGTPINQRNVHRSLARASKRAQLVPAVSAYDLRHTAITHQVERGIPVHKIADWAGTSERMIWETYRDKLDEISEIGPIDENNPIEL